MRRGRVVAAWWILVMGIWAASSAPTGQVPDPRALLFPGHPQRDQLLQTFQRAIEAADTWRLDEAIAHLDTILETVPDDPVTLYHRATVQLRLGAFADAERDLTRLLQIEPTLVPARVELAEAHARQGRVDEAIRLYLEALDRQPGDLVARWNLKLAYAQRGGYPPDLPLRYRLTLPPGAPSPVTFVDVAPALGMDTMSRARGSAWGDYDGDGDSDLVAVGIQHRHALFRHESDGTFAEVTAAAGLDDPRGGWASFFFDYDADRDLDLFVTRGGWRGRAVW